MKRCLGPCVGLAEPQAYAEQVAGTILFLRGKSRELVENIEREMAEAAAEERFEDAGRLRDRIQAVERTIESQQIVTEAGLDRDVFAIAREGGEVEVQVLHVREGRVIGARGFPFSNVRIDDDEVMSSFLGQFYGSGEGHAPPREVLTSTDFEDEGALVELWRGNASTRPSRFGDAQRGGGRRLVEIAERNAALALATRLAARESVDTALQELEERCRLSVRPHRIECYDVSNLQGTLAVASRVTFEDGEPVKKDYRRYRIKEAEAGDDYGCMREVLDRRLARVDTEPLPDLLMVDGGRGQVGVVMARARRCRARSRGAGHLEGARRRFAERAGEAGRRPQGRAHLPSGRSELRSCSRRAAAACCCSSASGTSRIASRSNSSGSCARRST